LTSVNSFNQFVRDRLSSNISALLLPTQWSPSDFFNRSLPKPSQLIAQRFHAPLNNEVTKGRNWVSDLGG
jgi:hypothetical protein